VNRTKFAMLGVAALAAALGGIWFLRDASVDTERRHTPTAMHQAANASKNASKKASVDPQASGADARSDPLATTSLRNTVEDGDVRFDANGMLVIDRDLRRRFDYYLSLIGEYELVQIRALFRRSLDNSIGPPRAAAVLDAFDRYVAFQRALDAAGIASVKDAAERLRRVSRLRRETLGAAMAEAFFGEEERLAELTLRRMRIASDPTLDANEKRAALIGLDAEAGHATRTEAGVSELIAEQNAQFAALRSTPEQRRAEREAAWGADAAQRLAQLDRARAAWDARVRTYIAERARIDADLRMDAQRRRQAIAALRARSFSPPEQRRVASLEAVGQLEATLGKP
jgi:lipase chaperone LimK